MRVREKLFEKVLSKTEVTEIPSPAFFTMARKKEKEEEKLEDKESRETKEKIEKEDDMKEEKEKKTEKKKKEKKEEVKEAKEGEEAKTIEKNETKKAGKKKEFAITKQDFLVSVETYIKTSSNLGTKAVTSDMRQYVYKKRADG